MRTINDRERIALMIRGALMIKGIEATTTEVLMRWGDYSREKYNTDWAPLLEKEQVDEFAAWLKERGFCE